MVSIDCHEYASILLAGIWQVLCGTQNHPFMVHRRVVLCTGEKTDIYSCDEVDVLRRLCQQAVHDVCCTVKWHHNRLCKTRYDSSLLNSAVRTAVAEFCATWAKQVFAGNTMQQEVVYTASATASLICWLSLLLPRFVHLHGTWNLTKKTAALVIAHQDSAPIFVHCYSKQEIHCFQKQHQL